MTRFYIQKIQNVYTQLEQTNEFSKPEGSKIGFTPTRMAGLRKSENNKCW